MNDEQLKRQLRQALAARRTGRTPDFEATLALTGERNCRSRKRYAVTAGIAAVAAIIAVSLGLWSSPGDQAPLEYLSEQALLDSTAWAAPSDVLLPRYAFDLYQDLPVLIESTEIQEGVLL